MEVVSTSNLVSQETEKTATERNIQTVMSHDLMRGQIGSQCKRDIIDLQFHDGKTVKTRRKNTYKENSKIKTDQQ